MDIRYRISGLGGIVTLRVLPDSKALLLATSAKGSCGVDPGPVRLRLNIVTLSASPMGDLPHGVRKRLVLVGSLIPSTSAILCFTALAVKGGGTDLALMRPTKGSPARGAAGAFERIAPSSA